MSAVLLGAGCGGAPERVPDAGEVPSGTTRAAAVAEEPAAVPAISGGAVAGRPVLFVGLDGADWQLLDRYVAAGRMPNLARLVEEGTGGVLRSLHPPLSPLLWTSAVTGVGALEHRVLDFTRYDPASGVREPIGSRERAVPAVWNMATWGGRSVAVFGLWATYPAEPVRGLMVSDRLFSFLYQEAEPPPRAVFPPGREGWARRALEEAETAVDFAALRSYLPWLEEAEYARRRRAEEPYAHPVSALTRILVETELYRRLALDWLAEHPTDLAIVYVQGTDSIGHVFAPYAPPRRPAVSVEEFQRYHRVPERYFEAVDDLLGELAAAAERRGAVLFLASDHGFRWSEGRPEEMSSHARATAAKWHREEGIYLLHGPGVAARPGHPEEGGLLQVCASLLALLGLPPGEGLAGPPLSGVPPGPAVADAVDYGAFYAPPSDARTSQGPAAASAPGVAAGEIAELEALGYLEASGSERAPPAGTTRTAGSWNNEGLLLRQEGRLAEAREAFESALEIAPDLASALWNLSDLLYGEGSELERSDGLLLAALENGLPGGARLVIGRAMAYQRTGSPSRSLGLVDAAVDRLPGDPELLLFRGRYRVEAGDCVGALEDFRTVERRRPDLPVAWASSGLALLCLGRPEEAATDFRRSLELDPDQPRIREYLARLAGGAG